MGRKLSADSHQLSDRRKRARLVNRSLSRKVAKQRPEIADYAESRKLMGDSCYFLISKGASSLKLTTDS
ncbi:MAG: hypothetical protein DMG71_02395, partial [Acidobacteria bacterium]